MTQTTPIEATPAMLETAHVIERTNLVEQKLLMIIARYLDVQEGAKKTFLESVLLNNSVVNLSSKFKAYRHLNVLHEDWPAPNAQQFQKIMNIRNAFAHNATNNQVIHVRQGEVVDRFVSYESVTGSGEVVSNDRRTALREFEEAYAIVDHHLMDVIALQQVSDNAENAGS